MATTKSESIIKMVNEIIQTGIDRGIGHLSTEDYQLNGRTITINGKKVINFGSSSYLGLEQHPLLKKGAIDAVERYGSQFSSSRSYLSCTNYTEYETLISQIFDNRPVLLSTSVSMGHLSVLPAIITGRDAVIYDQQAHFSMQEVFSKLHHNGTYLSILRHNKIEALENKINSLKDKYEKIWYIVDGVYSMFGDFAPLKEIEKLLNKYKQFHLYADDAHGMSWTGKNGSGYVLSQIDFHEKMVLAVSLNKSFGAGGGAFIFPNAELRDRVKLAGSYLTFSGPLQPASVGAGIASAKIHLSDKIYPLQKKLNERIEFCNYIFKKYKLPLISPLNSPIFFVGLGLTRMGYNMVRKVMNDGFYVNLGIFPAVPETCTGIRFSINNHQKFEDIENLAKSIAKNLPNALKEEERTVKDIVKAFRKFTTLNESELISENPIITIENDYLNIEKYSTIKNIDKNEWDNLLGNNGAFDYNNLIFLEDSFKENINKENNWKFFYYIVRDTNHKPILATFFTTVISKDDMLDSHNVSVEIEKIREKNRYYLTSKYFMMGSMLTHGNHLYLDKKNTSWKKAMIMLLDEVWTEQNNQQANSLFFRDFEDNDEIFSQFLKDQGMIKIDVPEDNLFNTIKFNTIEDYISSLKSEKRKKLKKEILVHEDLFNIEYNNYTDKDIETFYNLYLNVKNKNLGLNTFSLPLKLFKNICKSNHWDIMTIKYNNKIVSATFSVKTVNNYCPLIMGMDYNIPKEYNLYKQTLYQVIKRGINLNVDNIYLGFTASSTKRKLGARSIKSIAFIQQKDDFNSAEIRCMAINNS